MMYQTMNGLGQRYYSILVFSRFARMIRRLPCYILFTSMLLHCSGRLGLLDQLYGSRFVIAYSIGLIDEVPITVCNGEYDTRSAFTIETSDHSHSSLPSKFQVREINLFTVKVLSHIDFIPLSLSTPGQAFDDLYALILTKPIFHPPSA
jgi:hypothetical protein